MKSARVIWASLLIAAIPELPAMAAEIVPHAAKYTLSLKDATVKGRSGRATGVMEIRFSRDCYHWWVDRELKFDIRYSDGRKTNLVISERMRETLSGQNFWFWSRTTLNEKTVSIVSGNATRPEPDQMVDVEPAKPVPADKDAAKAAAGGQKDKAVKTAAAAADAAKKDEKPDAAAEKAKRPLGVRVKYDWPNTTEIELAPTVIFPVTALSHQLDALAAGALLREQPVLSGSRGTGAVRVIYSTVKGGVAVLVAAKGDTRLLDTRSWRFKVDQRPLEGGKSAKSIGTAVQKLHANGIVSEMLLNMGLFSIQARINTVKELPLPVCE